MVYLVYMQTYELTPSEQEIFSFDLSMCSYKIDNGRLMVRIRNSDDKICTLCERKRNIKADTHTIESLLLSLEEIEKSIDEVEDADEAIRLWETCEEIRRKMKWYDYYTNEEFDANTYYRQINDIYLHEKIMTESAYHI